MGAAQQALLAAATGSGSTNDANFADVVLLLHGTNFTDFSPLAHTVTSHANVTANNSTSNGTIGSKCFSSSSTSGSILWPSSTDFNNRAQFTQDFWTKFGTPNTFAQLMGQTSGNRYIRSDNFAGPVQLNGASYGMTGGGNVGTAVWQYWRLVCDGTTMSLYMGTAGDVNALRVDTATTFTSILTATGFDAMGISGGLGAIYDMMEFRFTQGVARNSPSLTSIPMQTAPWPDS